MCLAAALFRLQVCDVISQMNALQCVAVCCGVLQCVAVYVTSYVCDIISQMNALQCVAVCCGVLQCM